MHAGATTTRFLESLPFQPKAIEVLQPGMNTTIQARAAAASCSVPPFHVLPPCSWRFSAPVSVPGGTRRKHAGMVPRPLAVALRCRNHLRVSWPNICGLTEECELTWRMQSTGLPRADGLLARGGAAFRPHGRRGIPHGECARRQC